MAAKGRATRRKPVMILARMKSVRHAYGYREVFLLDTRGKQLLSISPDASPPVSPTLEVVKEAIGAQSIIFLDIVPRGESGDMGVAAPLLAIHGGKPEAIGAIYLQIYPSRFLFPLLKALPLGSKSMELVPVRRNARRGSRRIQKLCMLLARKRFQLADQFDVPHHTPCLI